MNRTKRPKLSKEEADKFCDDVKTITTLPIFDRMDFRRDPVASLKLHFSALREELEINERKVWQMAAELGIEKP